MAFINQGRHVGTVGLVEPETLGGEESLRDDINNEGFGTSGGGAGGVPQFKVHTYLSSGTFEVTGTKPVTMDVFALAGGGAGTNGGGGGGGFIQERVSLSAGVYDVLVGGGGSASPGEVSNGGDSLFRLQGDGNTNVGVADATGGGSGNVSSGFGGSGGASGGQGIDDSRDPNISIPTGEPFIFGQTTHGTSTYQGHNAGNTGPGCPGGGGGGGATGGGGGAGGPGTTAGAIGGHAPCGGCKGGGPGGSGGPGAANNYRTGSDVFYGGGGQGNGIQLTPAAPDGNVVAGHGGGGSANGSTNGAVNQGGGGGRSGFQLGPGGTAGNKGGSGIIVIRAPFPAKDGI